jgi:hypothetical protein
MMRKMAISGTVTRSFKTVIPTSPPMATVQLQICMVLSWWLRKGAATHVVAAPYVSADQLNWYTPWQLSC